MHGVVARRDRPQTGCCPLQLWDTGAALLASESEQRWDTPKRFSDSLDDCCMTAIESTESSTAAAGAKMRQTLMMMQILV